MSFPIQEEANARAILKEVGQTPLRVTVLNEKPTSSGAEAHTLLAGMENCSAITDGNIDNFQKVKSRTIMEPGDPTSGCVYSEN